MNKVAIVITTFRNPAKLNRLLDNMKWSGLPDVPLYVFEDRSPFPDHAEMTKAYEEIVDRWPEIRFFCTGNTWKCMQGIIDEALIWTREPWIIYVPDDVLFTKGALWNEVAGVLTYGRDFVGGIQAPYWNAQELEVMGILQNKEQMNNGWIPDGVPQNPHWNGYGLPRKYINLNGAGFSINRQLYEKMGGWPKCTWRLDEYAGYMAWKLGMVCITLPGPPRIHYFGGSTPDMPEDKPDFSSEENWKKATGGTPLETGHWTREIMERIPGETFDDILKYYQERP